VSGSNGTALVFHVVLGLLCGVLGTRVGWRTGRRLALPLIQGALGAFAFFAAWREADLGAAAAAVGGWALGTTLVSVRVFARDGERAERIVARAASYRAEMLSWLASGRGFESRALATILTHVRELALYLVTVALTANVLGLVMGAVLLNFMNAWVARLLRAAREPWTVRLLAWNAWSVVRVAAYVLLGAAAAAPIGARLGLPVERATVQALLLAGAAGAVLDLVLKLALSAPAGRRLARAVALDELATP
jgi:hypothetical protein